LYYTVSGIITPILTSSWLMLINKYIDMHGQQNKKKKNYIKIHFVPHRKHCFIITKNDGL